MDTNTAFDRFSEAHTAIDKAHAALRVVEEAAVGINQTIKVMEEFAAERFMAGETEQAVAIRDTVAHIKHMALNVRHAAREKEALAVHNTSVYEKNKYIDTQIDRTSTELVALQTKGVTKETFPVNYSTIKAYLMLDHVLTVFGPENTQALLGYLVKEKKD